MAKLRGKHFATKDITNYGKEYYEAGQNDTKIQIIELIGQEILWHKKYMKEINMDKQFKIGFVKGLRYTKELILMLEKTKVLDSEYKNKKIKQGQLLERSNN